MVFLGKIGIVPNEGDTGIAERLIRELNLPRAWPEVNDCECEIMFESEEIDPIIEALKAAKQGGKFLEWVLSYDLCRTHGFVLQEGIISEEYSLFRYPNGNIGS
jgi:hypothetical protein